jgi:tRNA G46 methylase TrmB
LRLVETRAERAKLDNVRFVAADAATRAARDPRSLRFAYYVFYPDPWPKKRHHKRRFCRPRTSTCARGRSCRRGGFTWRPTTDDYWTVIEASPRRATPLLHVSPSFGGWSSRSRWMVR